MDPQSRRRSGTSRVLPLHGDDGAFDREFWRAAGPQARLDAVWDLTLEYLAWTAPDGGEPRLQRSVCRLERGKAELIQNKMATGRPQDLVDVTSLQKA